MREAPSGVEGDRMKSSQPVGEGGVCEVPWGRSLG